MFTNLCLLILSTICFGQDDAKLPSDFPTLQKLSIEELELKTDAHDEVWGLRKHHRWDLVQEVGDLVFSFDDGFRAVAPAQIIGSYNSEDQTWLWAWANPSIHEKLRKDALK